MKNVEIIEPKDQAQACVIWMHGLGADAQDMLSLAGQLPLDRNIRHVCMNAPVRPVTINNRMPMRAWYDIIGLTITDRDDREGILQSEQLVCDVIAEQLSAGLRWEQLFLAGFSQGGAMALFTGLRIKKALGGIIALSSYLPLASEGNFVLGKHTPIFLARGSFDPIVMPKWTIQTAACLKEHGFQQVVTHEYPMAHAICPEEIRDLTDWLTQKIAAMTLCMVADYDDC